MNYQNYDDYMRNTLGFSGMNPSMGMPYGGCTNMGCAGMCQNPYTNMANSMWQNQSCNLENLYPDSYRVIYPMVVASCRNVTMPIAEDTIERMVKLAEKEKPDAVVIAGDIYDKAVSNTKISVSLTVETTNRESSEDRQMPNRPQRKPHRNPFLNDLIRILILRELIGGGRPRFPVL